VRAGVIDRGGVEHDIAHHLDEDAAEPDCDERARHRIALHADDGLEPAGHHLRQQNPARLRGRDLARGVLQHLAAGARTVLGRRDVEPDEAHFRLVRDRIVIDLHRHQSAEGGKCRRGRVVHRHTDEIHRVLRHDIGRQVARHGADRAVGERRRPQPLAVQVFGAHDGEVARIADDRDAVAVRDLRDAGEGDGEAE